jgi:dCMP deaminase
MICTKMIINAEIDHIFIAEQYPDQLASELLSEAGVDLILYHRDSGELSKLT